MRRPSDKWRPTASPSASPLSLPRKEAQEQLHSKQSSNIDLVQRIFLLSVAIWTQHLSRYGAMLAEDEEMNLEMNNSEFRPFQVGRLRTVSIH